MVATSCIPRLTPQQFYERIMAEYRMRVLNGRTPLDADPAHAISAIVAGVVSLRQRQEASPLDGPTIKQELLSLGSPNTDLSDWYWLPGPPIDPLQGDAINGPPPPNDLELFGDGGLVNVPRLLGL